MWRVGLRTKILLNNINGKFLNVIRGSNLVYFVSNVISVQLVLDKRKMGHLFFICTLH